MIQNHKYAECQGHRFSLSPFWALLPGSENTPPVYFSQKYSSIF